MKLGDYGVQWVAYIRSIQPVAADASSAPPQQQRGGASGVQRQFEGVLRIDGTEIDVPFGPRHIARLPDSPLVGHRVSCNLELENGAIMATRINTYVVPRKEKLEHTRVRWQYLVGLIVACVYFRDLPLTLCLLRFTV